MACEIDGLCLGPCLVVHQFGLRYTKMKSCCEWIFQLPRTFQIKIVLGKHHNWCSTYFPMQSYTVWVYFASPFLILFWLIFLDCTSRFWTRATNRRSILWGVSMLGKLLRLIIFRFPVLQEPFQVTILLFMTLATQNIHKHWSSCPKFSTCSTNPIEFDTASSPILWLRLGSAAPPVWKRCILCVAM